MHINKEETRHYSEMADQILNIIKEHERVKATEIAYILGTNRRTVNHYLYSELSGIVLKDDDHYWALKGTRLFQTTDGIYYLTEYIPKALRHYKSDEALEDSRLIKRFKENDREAIGIIKEKMAEAADGLCDPYYNLIVAAIPPSKTYKKNPMLEVAAYIRDYFNGPEGMEDPEFAFLDMFTRISDVATAHLSEPWNRPSFDEQKTSIRCNYPEYCNEYTQCLIIDDITTRGTQMQACKSLLLDNGMPEENIVMLAFARTVH